LPTLLYKSVILIGGRLHAANRKLKLKGLRSNIWTYGRPTADFFTFLERPKGPLQLLYLRFFTSDYFKPLKKAWLQNWLRLRLRLHWLS